jgi:hypothetical protein
MPMLAEPRQEKGLATEDSAFRNKTALMTHAARKASK